MNNYVLMLARVFSNEKYANDFIEKGGFRCNTLNFFKKYKDEFLNNIGDMDEGISSIILGKDLIIKIRPQGDDKFQAIEGLLKVQFCPNYILTKNIFCMYAPTVKVDEKYTLSEIEQIVSIPKDSEQLGDFIVLITKPDQFFLRLEREAKVRKLLISKGLVEYRSFDENLFIDSSKVGFIKNSLYSHQKEYRIMLDDGRGVDEPIDIEIGSLADIAYLIPLKDFNKSFSILPLK